ncbi:unnamed protein product [Ixodes persulcatus]
MKSFRRLSYRVMWMQCLPDLMTLIRYRRYKFPVSFRQTGICNTGLTHSGRCFGGNLQVRGAQSDVRYSQGNPGTLKD